LQIHKFEYVQLPTVWSKCFPFVNIWQTDKKLIRKAKVLCKCKSCLKVFNYQILKCAMELISWYTLFYTRCINLFVLLGRQKFKDFNSIPFWHLVITNHFLIVTMFVNVDTRIVDRQSEYLRVKVCSIDFHFHKNVIVDGS